MKMTNMLDRTIGIVESACVALSQRSMLRKCLYKGDGYSCNSQQDRDSREKPCAEKVTRTLHSQLALALFARHQDMKDRAPDCVALDRCEAPEGELPCQLRLDRLYVVSLELD